MIPIGQSPFGIPSFEVFSYEYLFPRLWYFPILFVPRLR